MASVRGLPFGRPPQQAPHVQFVEQRGRANPRADGWILSTLSGEVFTEVADSTLTANTLVLSRLKRLDTDYTLSQASIYVSGGSAGTYAYSGLYLYQKDDAPRFKLIAGTGATFDAGTTGRVDVTLPHKVQLVAGSQIFMGTLASSAVPTFTVAQGHTANVERVRTVATSTLPVEVSLAGSTGSTTTASALLVTYYSPEAAIIL